jgi:hypothetical protein
MADESQVLFPISAAFGEDGHVEIAALTSSNSFQFKECPSISHLFLELLYTEPADDIIIDTLVAPGWRDEISSTIEQIYFGHESVTSSNTLAPKQRFMLHQIVHGNLTSYTVRRSKNRAFLLDIIHQIPPSDLVSVDTYNGLLDKVIKYDLSVPVSDFYEFEGPMQFDYWVFQQIVDSGTIIHKCKLCKKYFIPPRKNANFCSNNCKQQFNALSKYGGNAELRRLAASITAIFMRKAKSSQRFVYLRPPLPAEYDNGALFAQVDITSPLEACDFKKIEQTFYTLNEARRLQYNELQKLCEERKLSTERLAQFGDEYLSWLTNVHTQMKAFSQSKRKYPVLDIDD